MRFEISMISRQRIKWSEKPFKVLVSPVGGPHSTGGIEEIPSWDGGGTKRANPVFGGGWGSGHEAVAGRTVQHRSRLANNNKIPPPSFFFSYGAGALFSILETRPPC